VKASPRESVAKRRRRQERRRRQKKASPRESVAKRKRRQEESVAKVEGVTQAQAPLRNMTEEKCTVYEVCAKVKRRYGNMV